MLASQTEGGRRRVILGSNFELHQNVLPFVSIYSDIINTTGDHFNPAPKIISFELKCCSRLIGCKIIVFRSR